jgi:hypothetical protein
MKRVASAGSETPVKADVSDGRVISRRQFASWLGLSGVARAFVRSPFAHEKGWITTAEAVRLDELHDTMNGFLVFLVPGPDPYSVAQGISTPEPGAIEANVTDVFIETLDDSAPYAPQFSAIVATILNDLALAVNPGVTGPFQSNFANLSFAEKVVVIQIMDSIPSLKPLSGILPAFGAYLTYSEAGVYDPATRSLTGTPVGWTLSNYEGVADGRDEMLGYLRR